MSRPGDWNCRSCQHLNFSRRDTCQTCNYPRTDEGGDQYCAIGGMGNCVPYDAILLPGDWYCSASTCGAHNFASRTSCFMCGKHKDGSGALHENASRGTVSYHDFKPGDWICLRPGCGVHNFASRTECYKCNAPKNYGSYQ